MDSNKTFAVLITGSTGLTVIGDKTKMLEFVTKHTGILNPEAKKMAGRIMDNDFSGFDPRNHTGCLLHGQVRSATIFICNKIDDEMEKPAKV